MTRIRGALRIEGQRAVVRARELARRARGQDRAFARGARAASEVADGYNGSSTHDHRLGDCILAKLNMRRGRPRRNRAAVEDPKRAWVRGLAYALAEIHRSLADGAESVAIVAACRAAGVDLQALRDAGVDPYDLRALQSAFRKAKHP